MKKKLFITLLLIYLLIPLTAFAHSGRTDRYGGHRDTHNVEGLGPYHFHCGGYPAHLHTDAICPYTLNTSKVITPTIAPTIKSTSSPTPTPVSTKNTNRRIPKGLVRGALLTGGLGFFLFGTRKNRPPY